MNTTVLWKCLYSTNVALVRLGRPMVVLGVYSSSSFKKDLKWGKSPLEVWRSDLVNDLVTLSKGPKHYLKAN